MVGSLRHDDDVTADLEYVIFAGDEANQIPSPLEQLFPFVVMPSSVWDGLHGKVVWHHHLLQLQPIESPLDGITGGIAHLVCPEAHVSHDFYV